MTRSPQQQLHPLTERYRRLAGQLAEVGWILKGSIVERHVPCGNPGCRCHADPPQLHGPYWQWSTAVNGKTVSRRLSEQQAQKYREWIDNRKRLEAILAQMHEITDQAAQLLPAKTPTTAKAPCPNPSQPPSHDLNETMSFSGGSSLA